MAEDDELLAPLEAEARLNDRLRRRLKGLQSTRVAIEGLIGQVAEASEKEAQDQARIRRLERANDALERRVAQLLLDRAQVQGERERVAAIAQGLEHLKAAAGAQQARLLEAEAEMGRLQGIEADALGLREELAEAESERDTLRHAARAWEAERAACLEHAEAFLATLVRLAARRPPTPSRDGGDCGEAEEEVSPQALLDTFFPDGHPLASADMGNSGSSSGLWASLRGVVETVSGLLAAHWRAQGTAAAEAERATGAEVEREMQQARAEEAEARLKQLAGDWEEARAAAKGLEPMVQTLRDNVLRAEQRVAELREELGVRDRFVGRVLARLGALASEGQDEEEQGSPAGAAPASPSSWSSSTNFVEVQFAVSAALSAAAERVRALEAHHKRAAGESQRREGELQRLARDFAELSVQHREMAAALARREESEEGLEVVVERQREELAAVRSRLEAAEVGRDELKRRLGRVEEEKVGLVEALAGAEVALREERAQARQRREELGGWQRYAQRCQQEVVEVSRSLHATSLGGGPPVAIASSGGICLRGLIGSPQRGSRSPRGLRQSGGSAASSRF